jgi:hypothetical protein
VFRDGLHLKRHLDGRVVAIDRERQADRLALTPRVLPEAEAREVDAWVQRTAQELARIVRSGRMVVELPPDGSASLDPAELSGLLDWAAGWDEAAWVDQRRRFLDTYAPLPVLPPEAASPLIVQATLGEAGGRSLTWEPTEELRVRSAEGFTDHVRNVRDLLGRRLAQSRTVVLCGPDALRQPLDTVLGWLETIRRELPMETGPSPSRLSQLGDEAPLLRGLGAMLNRFEGTPAVDGWRCLREAGLSWVSIGLAAHEPEAGRPGGAEWSRDELRTVVDLLHEARVRFSLLVPISPSPSCHRVVIELLECLDLKEPERVHLLVSRPTEAGVLPELIARFREASRVRVFTSFPDKDTF